MKFNRLAAAIALGVAGLSAALAAPTLSITPGQQHIAVGGAATVDIVISGLSGINEVVSGYDLNVTFNTGVLQWSVINLTPGVTAMGGASNVLLGFDSDDTDGDIGGDITSFQTDTELLALQADPFTLMTLSFIGVADGVSFLNFGADPDTQRLVTGLLDNFGIAGVLDLTYVGACISVGTGDCTTVPVPEPSSYALAGLALLGCGLATTRRRRQTESAAA